MKLNIQSALGAIGTAAIATTVAAVTAISAPVAANAATFNFSNINAPGTGNTSGDSLAPFLQFDVNDSGSGTKFDFKFLPNSEPSANAYIGRVFIDGEFSLLGIATLNVGNVGNVEYSGGLGTTQLPQSSNDFTTDYVFDRNTGDGNAKAVQKGESLGVLFANADFASVIAAIYAGELRVGYHVRTIIAAPGSDAFISAITTPPVRPVPVPGFLLGLAVAGGFGGSRLLKNKKQTA